MQDFWKSSGFHLLERDDAGHLAVTEDFLRAFFLRPELEPVEESCAAELKLHDDLLNDPRLTVPNERLMLIEDSDARENYEWVLKLRDRLVAAGTVEGAYMASFDAGRASLPPIFIDQLAHAILRNILDGASDPMRPRAAEILFREQRITIQDGNIMSADAEMVDSHSQTGGFGAIGQMLMEVGAPVSQLDLDVLRENNATMYWERSDRFDTVLDLSFATPGLDALARVLEAWIRHFQGVEVTIQPVQKISDERWVWHIGLDGDGTALLNDLYNGVEVGEARLARLLSLFRMEFRNPADQRADIAGRPIYLALGMSEARNTQIKPQNLLFNLPLADAA